MKLLVDDKPVSLSGKGSFELLVKKAVDALFSEYGDHNQKIYLEWNSRFITKAKNEREQEVIQYPTQKSFKPVFEYLSEYTEKENEGNKTVRMYLTSSRKKDNVIYHPNSWQYTGRMTFGRADTELLFFLVFVSPFCEYLPEERLKEFQNKNRRGEIWYTIASFEKQSVKTVEDTQLESKILYRITTDDEGHKLSMDQLKMACMKLGMNVSTINSESVLRSFLIGQVKKEKNISILQLLDSIINNDVSLEIFSHINIAKGKNIIQVFTRAGNVKAWCFVKEDGKAGDLIMKLSSAMKPDEQLTDFLKMDNDAYDRLKLEIEAASK